jgi:hypothetical protein
MNAARHNRVMEIFLAASELENGRRNDYLDSVCGDDDTLRTEVKSLLKHHTKRTLIADAPIPVIFSRELRNPNGKSPGLKRGSIFRRHPFLIIAGGALALLIGTAAWVHQSIKTSLQESLATHLQTVLDADVAALQNWIAIQMADVDAWSKKTELRQLVEEGVSAEKRNEPSADDASTLNAKLLELLEPVMHRQGFHSLGIVTPEGTVIASSRPRWVGAWISPTGAPYLSRLNRGETLFVIPSRERKFVAAIESSPTDPTVAVAAPVEGAQGTIVASLCFGFDVDDEFTRILSIAQLGATGETYAFDEEAVLLSDVRDRRNLEQIGLLAANDSCALHIEVRDPGGDMLAGFQPTEPLRSRPLTRLAARAIAGNDGLDVNGYRNYRGATVVGAWTWLQDYGFGVGTEITAAEAYQPLRYTSRAFLFLSGTVTALSLILAMTSSLAVRWRQRVGQAERLGAYDLGDLIGQGGMGKVYRAWHRSLKRTVAVKLLDGREADDEMVKRFRREALLTCQLTHPSTIQVYDFGRSADGSFYYAMEYVPGYTLQRLIAIEKHVCVERTLHILLQVCGSLREAHQKGLIHRDIKPANIMITERAGIADFVKVLDFGLAKPIRPQQNGDLTHSLTIVGTPQFIAPERILSLRDVDERSDLYSLGAVIFMLLTGRYMFPETEPAVLFRRMVCQDGPRPSRCSRQEIPAELDDLVESCLAVDRSSRPSSVLEIEQVAEQLAKRFPWTQSAAQDWWRGMKSNVRPSV